MKDSTAKSLQRLLEEQTHIAAYRLFQQKTLQGVIDLNKQIQQVIKLKNIELRKLFYSKYLELISCSQLISDLNGFANKIDNISDDINTKAAAYREQQVELKAREDLIGVIERTIRKGRYLEAMAMCVHEQINNLGLSAKQHRLLRILETDLLDKVFQRLEKHFNREELEHLVKTIAVFAYISARKYLAPDTNYERQYGANIGILLSTLPADGTPITLQQSLIAAASSVFKIKTSSIQNITTKQHLSEYIKDLQNIVGMCKTSLPKLYGQLSKVCSIEGQPTNLQLELKNMYRDCFNELHQSLAKSMISTDRKKVIFNHNLYQSILVDQELMNNFKELEEYFESKTHLQDILLNLWSDFYQQITEYSINNIDIAISLQNIIAKGNGIQPQYKVEIAKHACDKSASYAFEQARRYSLKLAAEFEQLKILFTKAHPSQLQKMHNILHQKYSQALAKSSQRIGQMLSNFTNLKIRINVVFACELLLSAVVDLSQFLGNFDANHKIRQTIFQAVQGIQKVTAYHIGLYLQEINYLKVQQQVTIIEDKLMEYVPLARQNRQSKALRQLTFRLLDQLQKDLKGRNLQKIKYTKRCLEGKQEQLTTLTCLFNFIPSHLFSQPAALERFNVKAMEDLLLQEKVTKRTFTKRQTKLNVDKRDFFETGAETGKDVLKFASKLSNSLVGLINRMSTL